MLCKICSTNFISGCLASSTATPPAHVCPPSVSCAWCLVWHDSWGFCPSFPPRGRLRHAFVHGQPVPVNPFEAVVLQQPLLPKREEDPRFNPLLETVMGGRARAQSLGFQCLPWATGAQPVEDGVQAVPVGTPALAAAEG